MFTLTDPHNPGAPLRYEGFDTETQDGAAVLIATEDRHLCFPAGFGECAEFLLAPAAPAAPARYLAWNLTYDAQAILKYLAVPQQESLVIRGHAVYGSTDPDPAPDPLRIRYLPGKELVISRGKGPARREARLYDLYPFQQTSLRSAAAKILGDDAAKHEIPEAWYTCMAAVLRDPATAPRLISYCRADARTCARIGEAIGASFLAAGCEFSRPLSPGYIAGQRFRDRIPKLDARMQRPFQFSYYGGRVEIHRRGAVGPTVSYDLRSAYPSVQATLCQPEDTARTDRYSPDAAYGSYLVRVTKLREPLAPYRPRGSTTILYPVGSWVEWYARPHLELLREAGARVEVLAAWEVYATPTLAFPEFPDYYARRKADPRLSIALKLLLNSSYGKLAEVRSRMIRVNGRVRHTDLTWTAPEGDTGVYRRIEVPGSLAYFPWAAHITSTTQAAITRAARRDWRSVVAIATDGIAYLAPGPGLDNVGLGLGQWEGPSPADESVYVACGFYAHRSGAGPWKARSRGAIPKGEFPSWFPPAGTRLKIPGLRADSLAQVRRHGDHARLNWLRSVTQVKAVNGDAKREWSDTFASAADVLTTSHVSRPWVIHETEAESRSRLAAQGRPFPPDL